MHARRRRPGLLAPVLAVLVLACAPAAQAARSARGSHAVQLTIALAPRDPAALAAYARAVTVPGSPLYRHYLSVAQFARRFGAGRARVAQVRRELATRGLIAGRVSANGLELPVRAPARTTFTTAFARRSGPGSSFWAGGGLGDLVQGVIGPNAPAPTASAIVRSPHRSPRHSPRRRSSRRRGPIAYATGAGTPQPCRAAQSVAGGGSAYTADQIASAYGLSGYWAAGDQGRGVTIALYELEPFSAADVAAYQACYGTAARVQVVPVDGGAGAGAGSGEAAMDVEDAIGLAPQASIRVYEAPATGAGAYNAYSRIVSDDAAQVISTSWGLCEALEGSASVAAESTLFQEAAVQGQSLLASAGDQGSDDCGDGSQSVDDPASQPWVTAVGATSLQATGNVVWNDTLGATGGGVSRLWGRPSYQAGVVPAQSAIRCGASGTACRALPDLSVDGDPNSGYVIYWRRAWRIVGGSSVSAPTMAALTALADASPACGGHPIGFMNPALYGAAASAYTANFQDVTSGDNSFDAVAGFTAGPGYDMASGLGTPGPSLGQTLCQRALTSRPAPPQSSKSNGARAVKASRTVRVRRLRNQIGHVGERVRVRVRVRGHRGSASPLRYSATGLPPGLSVDHRTGVISGRPTRAGSHVVRVHVRAGGGLVATITFRWTIAARP